MQNKKIELNDKKSNTSPSSAKGLTKKTIDKIEINPRQDEPPKSMYERTDDAVAETTVSELVAEMQQQLSSEGLLDEAVLNLQQRLKRRTIMRQYKTKIAQAKERAQRKMADQPHLVRRAEKAARNIARKKFAGQRGVQYQELSPSDKISVDKLIDKKGALIKKIASRLLPVIRKKEIQRLASFRSGEALKPEHTPAGLMKEDDMMTFAEATAPRKRGRPASAATLAKRAATPKNKNMDDEDDYGPDNGREPDQNIIMQLHKAISMDGKKEVNFDQGGNAFVKPKHAEKALSHYNSLKKPAEKLDFIKKISTSHSHLKQAINEDADLFAIIENVMDRIDEDSMLSEEVVTGLKKKAEKSGMPLAVLKKVYKRGMSSYKSGLREDTTPQQWAFARVNSFIAGGKTTTTTDADLWEKVNEVKTPQEKFKAGLKKSGYDPDAGAKRLTDLIAKQKAERAEHEKKYGHLYGEEVELDEATAPGLAEKAKKSGVSLSTLRTVYKRGVAAWNSGHRPGTTPQQWGMARVNSYITKGKGTYGGADKDLREETAAVKSLESSLKKPTSYDAIDQMMKTISKESGISPKELHTQFVKKHGKTPDEYAKNGLSKKQIDESGSKVVWKKGSNHIEKYSDDAYALYVDGKKQKFFTSIDAAKAAINLGEGVAKDKESGLSKKYVAGLSASTAKARAAHFAKADKLSDSDPRAYEPAPGDATAKTKESVYTKKYKEMYGEASTMKNFKRFVTGKLPSDRASAEGEKMIDAHSAGDKEAMMKHAKRAEKFDRLTNKPVNEDAASHLRTAAALQAKGKPQLASIHKKIAIALSRGDTTTARGYGKELSRVKSSLSMKKESIDESIQYNVIDYSNMKPVAAPTMVEMKEYMPSIQAGFEHHPSVAKLLSIKEMRAQQKLTVKNQTRDNMEKDPDDQIFAGSYRTQHFEVSPEAQKLYMNLPKEVDPNVAASSAVSHDKLLHIYKKVSVSDFATPEDIATAKTHASHIMKFAKSMNLEKEHGYINDIMRQITDAKTDEVERPPSDNLADDPRFQSLPKDVKQEVGPGNDKDIDNLKNYKISRNLKAQRKLKIIDND